MTGARGRAADALLERQAEIDMITAALDGVAAGRGSTILLEGEAGAGKTTLLAAAEERATRRGQQVLRARAAELERAFSYGVARQLFEPTVQRLGDDGRTRLLRGAATAAGAVLGLAAGGARVDDPQAANHGLFWLAAGLAETTPLILSIDDAHWADRASLLFLHHLGRRLAGLPVLVLLATRPAEPGAERELVDAIRALADTRSIRPAPLSVEATAQILARITAAEPEPAFTEACHEVTGGNPFLVSELAHDVSARGLAPSAAAAGEVRELGPRSISAAVFGRLRQLWPEARALTDAVAVLDHDASLHLAGALAELPAAEADRAADALADARILAGVRPLRFVHPVVRRAVYDDLGEHERRRAHRRAATLLSEHDADPDRTAVHLLRCEPRGDAWVTDRLRAAAARALARGDARSATTLLRRAMDEPPPPDAQLHTTLELGSAQLTAGDAGVIELLETALGDAEAADRPAVVELLGRAHAVFGDPHRAAELLTTAVENVPADESARRFTLQASYLALAANAEALAREGLAAADALVPRLTGARSGDALLLAGAAHLRVFAMSGTSAEAARLAARAVAAPSPAETGASTTVFWVAACVALLLDDRVEDALRVVRRMEADAQRRGSPSAYAAMHLAAARVALYGGDLAGAEEHAGWVTENVTDLGPVYRDYALSSLVYALVEQGRADEADARLDDAGLLTGPLSPTSSSHTLLLARGLLHRTQSRLGAALSDAEDSLRRQQVRGGCFPIPIASGARALSLAAAGQPVHARHEADRFAEASKSYGPDGQRGQAAIVRALVAADETTLAGLQSAVGLLADSPRRLDRARAWIELGAALRRARRRVDAREPLRAGIDLAVRCGAVPLADRGRTELLACGARPRSLVLHGPESLTPSERRVAELAAAGRTNAEIAQLLFITRKTVEAHLGRAYGKLGVSSRTALPSALAAP